MKLSKSFANTLIVVLAVLMAAGCGGAESRKAKYLDRGKNYLEQQNYDKAKLEFKNALQIDPKFTEAYYQLGIVEEARQDWPQAFGNYSKAVELDPENIEARVKLGRLYLLSGNTEKAGEMTEAILAKQPGNIMGKILKVGIMAKTGDVRNAMVQAHELATANPSSPDAVDLLASLYLGQNNLDKAAEVLKKGLASHPKHIAFRLTLAQIYMNQQEPDKAIQLVQEIISLEPKKLQHRAALASLYARINQVDNAEKTLREAIQADPKDIDRYLLLADLLATRKSIAAAETELRAAIKANPDAHRLRFGLAKLYETAEQQDKLLRVYREIIEEDDTGKDGLQARNRLTEQYLKLGQHVGAEKLIREVLNKNPKDNDALLNRARLALLKKDPETAITALRQVTRDQPGSIVAHNLLSSAHLAKNELELARETMQKMVEVNPENVRALLAYSQFQARNKDIDGALKTVEKALNLSPDDLEAWLARMDLLATKRDIKGAQSVIATIKQKHPDKAAGYFHMGRLLISQKRYDEAVREFEQALARSGYKDSFQVLSAIVTTRLAQNKPDLAVTRLQQLLKESPDHLFAYELLAEVYITKKQYDEAEKNLLAAIKNNPIWNVPYRNLANLYMVRGDNRAAAETYRKGLEAIPDDTQLLLHLAGAYERTRDFEKAIAMYERVLQKNPDEELAINNLASLLVDQRSDVADLKRARELALRFESSSKPAFMDTLGWVYYKSGEVDKAIPILKDVVKQAPNVPVFNYHLGMAYYKQGDHASAKTHLAKALADGKVRFAGSEEAKETLRKIQ